MNLTNVMKDNTANSKSRGHLPLAVSRFNYYFHFITVIQYSTMDEYAFLFYILQEPTNLTNL
jgi:hypothetical protein